MGLASSVVTSIKTKVTPSIKDDQPKTMDTCRNLPELKINLEDNQEDVYKLLEIIKPTWKKDDIKIKKLSGGFSACMVRCSVDTPSKESVTVRVRDYLADIRDPNIECQAAKAVGSAGYFTPVLAIFQNGFCYEYVPGRSVLITDAEAVAIEEEQVGLIARQMANVHSVKVPEFDHNKLGYFDFIVELLSTSKPCCDSCPSMDELSEEVRVIEEFVSSLESPLVLNHGDAHPGNFVWDEEKRKITFVDWELAQVAPRAIDIAYFLDSFENIAHCLGIPSNPPTDFKQQFCLPYLQRWNEIHNKPPPTEEELDKLQKEIKNYLLVVLLVGAIYTVRLQEVNAKFGPVESMWNYYYERYLSAKEELLGIHRLGKPGDSEVM